MSLAPLLNANPTIQVHVTLLSGRIMHAVVFGP
jgi:uncharacterized membrane protein